MPPLTFAIVGLRLIGIYYVAEAASTMATMSVERLFYERIVENLEHPWHETYFASLLPGGLEAALGILLIVFAVPLARRLTLSATNDSKTVSCSLEDVQAIAFAAAGIVILGSVLPNVGRAIYDLLAFLSFYGFSARDGTVVSDQFRGASLHAIGVIGQLFLGLLLLFKPQAIRKLWHWMRTAGTGPKDNLEPGDRH